ncbi:MAG: helix-turn-helix transcriptional regulator [Clostridia bacterium]|nr:helix-turn-helix transcriptional regulator [Clostridia bacterium]
MPANVHAGAVSPVLPVPMISLMPGVTLCRLPAGAVRGGAAVELYHCLEGRLEVCSGDDCCYLTAGESLLCRAGAQAGGPLPVGTGVVLSLADDAPLPATLLPELKGRTPAALCLPLLEHGPCFLPADDGAAPLLSSIASLAAAGEEAVCRLRLLELLLQLSSRDPAPRRSPPNRCPAIQAALAKEVHRYLGDHLERHVTTAELSARFGASQTSLKSCFRCVFGDSLFHSARAMKMEAAAQLLRESDRSVLDIAGSFGYDNAGKFAAAFRDVVGMTPSACREAARSAACTAPEGAPV